MVLIQQTMNFNFYSKQIDLFSHLIPPLFSAQWWTVLASVCILFQSLANAAPQCPLTQKALSNQDRTKLEEELEITSTLLNLNVSREYYICSHAIFPDLISLPERIIYQPVLSMDQIPEANRSKRQISEPGKHIFVFCLEQRRNPTANRNSSVFSTLCCSCMTKTSNRKLLTWRKMRQQIELGSKSELLVNFNTSANVCSKANKSIYYIILFYAC